MKYFARNRITKEQVNRLKDTLKVYVVNKTINYNGNFIDHITMEKGIRVIPEDSEMLRLIEEYLEPWTDDWNVIQMQIQNDSWLEYDYDRLPGKLKRYMYSVDSALYEQWYYGIRYSVPAAQYDDRISKLEKVLPDYTDDEFIDFVLLGRAIPTPIMIKARASAKRAYRTVDGYIKTNIDRFKQFVTLTLAPAKKKQLHLKRNAERGKEEEDLIFEYADGSDFEKAKKAYSDAIDNLKVRLKRKGIPFEYITVWELHDNGNYHFHMICTEIPKEELYAVPEWLDYDHIEKKRKNGTGLRVWKYGKSDVQEIRDKARLTTYVSKYIIKSFQNVSEKDYIQYLNKRKFFPSTGLDKPESVYALIDLDKVQGLEAYETEYINPYNDGIISRKRYTKVI